MKCENCAKGIAIIAMAVIAVLLWPITLIVGIIYVIYRIQKEPASQGQASISDSSHGYYGDFHSGQPSSSDCYSANTSDLALLDDSVFVVGKTGCVLELERMHYLGENQFDFSIEGVEEKTRYIRSLLARNRERTDREWKEQVAPTLLGALGELNTLKSLAELRGPFVVINNLQLFFDPPFRNMENGEVDFVVTSQIDHVAIGPTGVFAIESKNWGPTTQSQADYSPIKQTRRAGKALWFFLNERLPSESARVRSILSLTGSADFESTYWVRVVPSNRVGQYIMRRNSHLPIGEIEVIAEMLLSADDRPMR